jgi:hypothetical protein
VSSSFASSAFCDHNSIEPGGAWPELGTGDHIWSDPGNDPGLFGVGGSVNDICDNKCSKPGLGGGKWPGLGTGGSTWSDPGNDHRVYAICYIISGLGGGA